MKAVITAWLLLALATAAGCSTNDASTAAAPAAQAPAAQAPATDLRPCTDPRPEICTQEYNPVCATLNDAGVRTYATGCTACADEKVAGWVPGTCD